MSNLEGRAFGVGPTSNEKRLVPACSMQETGGRLTRPMFNGFVLRPKAITGSGSVPCAATVMDIVESENDGKFHSRSSRNDIAATIETMVEMLVVAGRFVHVGGPTGSVRFTNIYGEVVRCC